MTIPQFTLDDLKTILRAGAGESVDLDGDILDTHFEQLGYDSLALLETGSRIERGYGIALDDAVLAQVDTPRALVSVVNAQLAAG
jgi:minimal PKS acyl carrier protein